jgi:hypothetical protein
MHGIKNLSDQSYLYISFGFTTVRKMRQGGQDDNGYNVNIKRLSR